MIPPAPVEVHQRQELVGVTYLVALHALISHHGSSSGWTVDEAKRIAEKSADALLGPREAAP